MTGATPVSRRVDRLRERFESIGVDAFLVTAAPNVRWLTGFSGSNATVVVTAERLVVVTDARYTLQAQTEADRVGIEIELRITHDPTPEIARAVQPDQRLGFESDHLTVTRLRALEGGVPTALVATNGVLEELRQIKSETEVEALVAAARIADIAFARIARQLCDPSERAPTERMVAAELDHLMRIGGSDGTSFETIVASGPNGALPHARPGDRLIERGDLVVIDFGARVDGYGSDMTRTVVAGGSPSGRQVELYDAVLAAQQAGVAAVRDGVAEVDIDRACRSVLIERGLGEAFTHGTGHGIGLEIHEPPILSTRSVGILRAGLVITVEPGVYLPGFGGIRVEDSVVVTSEGCTPITRSPKGLVPIFQESEASEDLPWP